MPLVTSKKMLLKAKKGQYAVGHFNTSNLEMTQAIIEAAQITNSPVIVATSKSAIKYAGYKPLSAIVSSIARKASVPVALHLDHGPDFEHVKNCVKNGWTSIMRDASGLSFNDNVKETRKVTKYCHAKKIPVEGELGVLKGEEGWVHSENSLFTSPDKAKEFVKLTKVDFLAVSIGTSHGAHKFSGRPKLDLKRLSEIESIVSTPLVLHGASHIPIREINKANKYGGMIDTTSKGVPDNQLRAAIRRGICKVNTDTDLRIVFTSSTRSYLSKNKEEFNPRSILGAVRDDLIKHICKRMDVLGSSSKA